MVALRGSDVCYTFEYLEVAQYPLQGRESSGGNGHVMSAPGVLFCRNIR